MAVYWLKCPQARASFFSLRTGFSVFLPEGYSLACQEQDSKTFVNLKTPDGRMRRYQDGSIMPTQNTP